LVALLLAARVAGFYTDVLWYRSIGFTPVYWSLLATKAALGVVAGMVVTAVVGGNLLLARRLAPTVRVSSPQEDTVERYREALTPHARPLLLAVAAVLGVLSGLAMVKRWPVYLLWANAQEFGRVDPVFGRDLGFFVFVLPFHVLLNSWLFTTLLVTLVAAAAAHYVFGGIRPQSPAQRVTAQANVHLSLLLAAVVAVRAWGFRLDQFLLSYSQRGQVTGLSYTDVTAQLPAYRLLLVIAVVCVALFLVNVRFRGWLLPSAGVGILVVASVVLAGVFPAIVQRLRVDPQELERERPFIEDNVAATRFAYGLDDVAVEQFPADPQLSRAEVQDNAETLTSLRLWEPTVALAAYEQLQELRPYYEFHDVDTDRYDVDGAPQQVLVAARELAPRNLPSATWQNRHLRFTHGIGMVASAVSTASPDGQPVFLLDDIPPQGVPALEVANPRVYFGESPPEYSVVGTRQNELDFVRAEGTPEEFRYDGRDGVAVGSFARRLAFAVRFAEPNMVLSNLLTADSKVLFRRQVRERVAAVAPFLKLDHDVYAVAAGGRIQWVVDGYTTTDMVPYSERVELGALTQAEQRRLFTRTGPGGVPVVEERGVELAGIEGRANYIRNSVKAVVDAYDGTVTLYVVDERDPVIRAWRAAFPGAFRSGADIDPDLRAHFRYPEDMFRVQAAVYGTYHITEAGEFYSKEDAWKLPNDPAFASNQLAVPQAQRRARVLRPLYQLLRLPGDTDPEFALLQPYTPRGEDRDNLIAYLVARSEPERYGQLQALLMPPGETVFGPEQVQARINQDGEISRELSLLNQRGSAVIYGNLLTIPIGDALLYAQGLFLRAEQSEIPELTKVVLVFGDRVVMRDTLAEALEALFGVAPAGVRGPEDAGVTGAPPSDGDPGAA
ncbi:MAG: UPF0182 family protein, partial [Actinomycetota bacterium]|nr:UPF0182 family protein [Actinomycetota bacterium]